MSPGLEKWHQARVAPSGGADEIRTRDPLLAKQVLYQLSYDPSVEGCRERTLSSKFTLCDQLRPGLPLRSCDHSLRPSTIGAYHLRDSCRLLRKEVIQPQVPLRLPCYDF